MKISRLLILCVSLVLCNSSDAISQTKIIETVGGTGTAGFLGDNGQATAARMSANYLMAMDASGDLYFADNGNARVRKIDPVTGIITTVAGGGATLGDGGPATAAQIGASGGPNPGVVGVALDPAANFLYIADGTNNRIRVVSLATGIITTICGTGTAGFTADGSPATSTQVSAPRGLAVDAALNVYYSDAGNQRIRMISSSTGTVTTIAGTGTAGYGSDGVAATSTTINNVRGLTVDASGNVYIADQTNNRIRMIAAGTNIITTVAGNGTAGYLADGVAATSTRINLPTDVKFDAAGNMYIADVSNNRIRMVNTSGIISTIAGTGTAGNTGDGGAATAARLSSPVGLAIEASGRYYYVADRNNNKIRQVRPNSIPYFPGGTNMSLVVCENAVGDSINTLTPAHDTDMLQTLTWSINTAPTHGVAAAAYTHATTGGSITPVGMYYTPTTGYSGPDMFIVQVSDAFNISYDTINVTVNPLPVVLPITGPTSVCIGNTIDLADVTPGGTWAATNGNASVVGGTVTGIVGGIDTISYAVTNACGTTTVTVAVTVITSPAPITGTLLACVGATSLLSDGGGGTWSSSLPGTASVVPATGLVTGVAGGTADITYSLGGTCFIIATFTVNPLPAAITPGTPVSICVGSTASLGDATPGGTWTSGTPTVATVSGVGLVTGILAGTSNISYTSTSGCSVVKTVTVTTAPAPLSPSGATVCPGATVTFTESAGGGVWSSAAPGIASMAAGIVTGVAAGTTSISYTIGTCAVGAPVTVNAAPAAITPPAAVTICIGATASLGDATPGGTWSSASTAIATVGSAGLVTGVSAGTVNISYTNGAGCSAVKSVTVLPTPVALSPASATVCVGSTVTFTESVGGGAWSINNPAIASVVGGVVTGLSSGTGVISYSIGTCYVTAPVTVNPLPNASIITGPLSICTGTPITYTDPAPGGIWSSSNPAIASVTGTGVVTGITVGTITLSYTVSNSCGSASATKSVSVGLAPSAGVITGASVICAGTFTTLVDTNTGGTWSVSNGNASITGTGLLVGITPGTDTVSYSITNACGTVSATKIITIGPFLTSGSISGLSSVCVGSTITLTDPIVGGVWSSSNASATVSGTGVVTGAAGGVDTINYTVTASCGSAIASKVITVVPIPAAGTITGPFIVCAGSVTTYTDAAPGGVWGTTNATASVTAGGVLTAITTGTDTVTYTITNSCGSSTASLAVSIGAAISAGTISGPSSVCVGASISLTDASPGGSWSAANGHATVIAGIVTGVIAGIDTIIYTVTSGCGTVTAIYPIVVNPLPDAGAVSGPATLCLGVPATYTDAAPGGVWSVLNSTAVITLGGVATPVSAGTDTVIYTVTNSCGTATATEVVNIPATLTAGTITGPAAVCIGSAITLSDATPGGTWSASNSNATVVGGVVTGVSSGTVTISYTVSSSCGSVTATKIVAVDNIPFAGTISGPSAVCLGSPITLTDAAPGGAWSASNPTATVSIAGVVTAIIPGTDTISYTVTNSCGSTAATAVIAVSTGMPTAGTITGPSAVCTGSTITLTDATPGGVWNRSNASATVSGGVVTGVTPGTDTITYVVTNSCGSATASAVITVGAALVTGTITGPTAVCTGSTITLTDAAPGGAWSSSNANATVAGGVVTGVTAGLATISYTVTGACGTASATLAITISLAPNAGTITGPTGVCAGSSITLADAAPGGVWSASNARAIVSVSGVVNGVIAGLDTIRYTVTNSCGSAVATRPIAVNSLPNVGTVGGASSVCPGASATLTHTVSGGVWSSNNTSVATISTTGTVTGVTSGVATISYTLTNSCGHASAIHSMTVLSPSLCGGTIVNGPVAGNVEGLKVAPNPNQGVFTMSLISDNEEAVHVVIMNVIGERVKEFNTTTNKVIDIQLGNAAGIYLLSATTANNRYVTKVIIN